MYTIIKVIQNTVYDIYIPKINSLLRLIFIFLVISKYIINHKPCHYTIKNKIKFLYSQ